MAVSSFLAAVESSGLKFTIRQMDDSTHTAQQAADAIGCTVGAIVKSLLFAAGDEFVLVLASGASRVQPSRVEAIVGHEAVIADARSVKRITGYSIGGVPPLGHSTQLLTIMDSALLEFAEVWAAAGSSRAVFPVEPMLLARLTSAQIARVN